MGISAVPGAGKTFTLSALAAQLITQQKIAADQDILIVTLVNAAVENFSARINTMIEQRGLIPHLGYRVRTLHGLAHDIVRERPSLAGLDERFQIVDEHESEFIRKEAVNAWLAAYSHVFDPYLKSDLEDNRINSLRNQQIPELILNLANAFIRTCKNRTIPPQEIRRKLDAAPAPLPLAETAWWIYDKYQQALHYRGAVDFDDLIMLAYKTLLSDSDYLARLQHRFPFILEDEAQDSSDIQEKILRLLAGHGNWVRVGDPNQAIFETFTTANPKLLKNFIALEADQKKELPVSGRSQRNIINLANELIRWTNASHPARACRDALSIPYIQAASPDDPQPNPPENPEAIRLIQKKYTPQEELEAVAASIKKWLPEHLESTIAVLVTSNSRGFSAIEMFKRHHIACMEVLASTNTTRIAAGAIANIMAYLAEPSSSGKLSRAYQVWRREFFSTDRKKTQLPPAGEADNTPPNRPITTKEDAVKAAHFLHRLEKTENFVAPFDERNWVITLEKDGMPPEVLQELLEFQIVIKRWLNAALLPVDQLILTLAQEIFTEPTDLALAHKLALVLHQTANDHPDWRLPELTAELGIIARNERKFLGFSADDSGFNPEAHKGKVVVTTLHKAKGLEWDRVYILSANNYDFPSLQPSDMYISERWYIRDQLNLQAETLAQLDALYANGEYDVYEEGAATITSREDYARERLRLLYVGITRAKRDLIITWNTGRSGDLSPCRAFSALVDHHPSN